MQTIRVTEAMPDTTTATNGNPARANPVQKIIGWIDRKLDTRADAWLDRLGAGRRNLLKVADVFTLNDDKQALIADVEAMGSLTLGYPKIRALSDKLVWVILAMIACGAIGVFAVTQLGANTLVGAVPVVVFVVFCLVVLLPLSVFDKRCDEYYMPMVHRFAAIELGIDYGQTQPSMDRGQIETLFSPFLQRGNNSNEIGQVASGELTVGGTQYPYTFFSYEYSDREAGATDDNNVHDNFRGYTRWGIVLQNLPVQGVALSAAKNKFFEEQWDTASLDFNEQCRVTAADQMAAARLLQPAVVEKLTAWIDEEPDFELAFLAEQPAMLWLSHRDVFATDTDFTDADTASQLAARLKVETLPGYRATLDRMRELLTITGDWM